MPTKEWEEIVKELGDVLWYLAAMADELGTTLNHVAEVNLEKLRDRKERGVIKSSGDNR
jgi:NTP pyrophosphatase (non-canonical NTP hydrolase)